MLVIKLFIPLTGHKIFKFIKTHEKLNKDSVEFLQAKFKKIQKYLILFFNKLN